MGIAKKILPLLTVLLLTVANAAAAVTDVKTLVGVSASTGGQAAQGTVTTGDQSVTVKVENIVNGQSIAPVELELDPGALTDDVRLRRNVTGVIGDATAQVTTDVQINGPESSTPSARVQQPERTDSYLPVAPLAPNDPRNLIVSILDWFRDLWSALSQPSVH